MIKPQNKKKRYRAPIRGLGFQISCCNGQWPLHPPGAVSSSLHSSFVLMKSTADQLTCSWGRLPFPSPVSGPIQMAQHMQPLPRANHAPWLILCCRMWPGCLAGWLQRVPGRRARVGRRLMEARNSLIHLSLVVLSPDCWG